MAPLNEQLAFINDSLARIRWRRPAWKDRYTMGPVLSEADIVAFEKLHECQLPREYREFLKQVGNGGAGPDYGLYRLGEHLPGSQAEECLEDDVRLAVPFSHMAAWNDPPPRDAPDEAMEEYFSPRHADGSILFTDRGCALHTRLVITGILAGTIWRDSRADDKGIYPLTGDDGAPITFLRWYLDWVTAEVNKWGQGEPKKRPGAR